MSGNTPRAAADNRWEVVVFTLGKEAFAINVNKTREILRWMGCRPVPKTSPAFVGITTVRGVALPLVDLRLFLGIDSPVPLEQTKVMIVEFNDVRLGFLVDAVERIGQPQRQRGLRAPQRFSIGTQQWRSGEHRPVEQPLRSSGQAP